MKSISIGKGDIKREVMRLYYIRASIKIVRKQR